MQRDRNHKNWQGWGLLLGIGIVLTTRPALANSWTPLVHTTYMHLFLGNLIIGYIEGSLLAKWFRLPRFQTVLTLILANYTSAWGGMLITVFIKSGITFLTIENIHIWQWIFAIFMFLVTLLIEYPFFQISLRKQSEATVKTVKSLLVIHGISYLLLAAWYVAQSQTSMLTQLELVPVDTLDLPGQYQLYFKSPDGVQTMQSNLTGSNIKSISLADFQTQQLTIPKEPHSPDRRLIRRGQFFDQPILKLAEDSDWDFYIRYLQGRGIAGLRNRELGQLEFEFTLETPFAHWPVRHATHLPGDFVVFQLGDDQICILHPHDRLIALVTRGREPFVVAAGDEP
jgi:hypothetical protein